MRVRVRSGDQLGMLGETLNDMSRGLQEKAETERRNRTLELERAVMEEEIRLARQIQLSLLPGELPVLPGASVAFKYAPMSAVGGDLLDLYYHEEAGTLSLFVCDVSGHGVPAALTASMVKMGLSTWGETAADPAATLARLRRSLLGKMGGNFITAAIASLDLASGRLALSCAGHPPFLLLRGSGGVEIIKPRGFFISDITEARYDVAQAALAAGDKLVLYTDGIIEARNASDAMLGEEAFVAFARSRTSLDPASLCEALYEHVMAYSGGNPGDDVTILAAEWNGPSR